MPRGEYLQNEIFLSLLFVVRSTLLFFFAFSKNQIQCEKGSNVVKHYMFILIPQNRVTQELYPNIWLPWKREFLIRHSSSSNQKRDLNHGVNKSVVKNYT